MYQNINNGEAEWVTTNFFDTDADDKIIEHWDIIAPYASTTPSGHPSIDGPTEITDLDRTEQNKAIIREMIQEVLIPGGDPSRVGEFISSDYIQHTNAQCDVFRLKNGLVVEHWDNVEPVGPEAEWANSGKV